MEHPSRQDVIAALKLLSRTRNYWTPMLDERGQEAYREWHKQVYAGLAMDAPDPRNAHVQPAMADVLNSLSPKVPRFIAEAGATP